MSVENKVKVKFVKNLCFVASAACLYWIDEIHVDESLKDSPALNDIIRHEMKHYEIFQKVSVSKPWKKDLLLIYNIVWNMFSCWKIQFKHFRQFKLECLRDLAVFSFIIFTVLVSLKVV